MIPFSYKSIISKNVTTEYETKLNLQERYGLLVCSKRNESYIVS